MTLIESVQKSLLLVLSYFMLDIHVHVCRLSALLQISAEFSEQTVSPGSSVSLSINTNAGSRVAINSVDSRVLLIGTSNWINEGKV